LAWIWVAGLTLLYALTLRPSIGWYDTPEFVDVAYTLGIPHPPGSPAYVLLGKLATLIPLGGIAVRMNLLSALCAVLALVLLARCVADLHGRLDGRGSSGWLGGVLAATGLAVAPTYWAYATQSEAYAPFALFVALLLFLALRWDRTRDERYLLSGAFVFGLSGGIHGTSLFFAPALAFFVLTGLPRDRWAGTLLRAAFFGILGASVYLYLPLRAGAEPPINWGHPDTWSRFWIHVSDRKDAAYHFPVASKPWWPYIRQFALNLNAELTPAGWLAGLGGLGVLLWRSWRVGIFTLLFCLGNLLFFIQIWTIPDGFMPTFFLVTFWGGMALACLLEARRVALRAAAGALCLTFLVFVGVQAHDGSHRARARATDAARFAVAANLLPLPEDTLVFVTANWFALRYLQDVEGMRPDVTIVLPSDLTRPMHFTPITVSSSCSGRTSDACRSTGSPSRSSTRTSTPISTPGVTSGGSTPTDPRPSLRRRWSLTSTISASTWAGPSRRRAPWPPIGPATAAARWPRTRKRSSTTPTSWASRPISSSFTVIPAGRSRSWSWRSA
jgi:hypothetical protein